MGKYSFMCRNDKKKMSLLRDFTAIDHLMVVKSHH